MKTQSLQWITICLFTVTAIAFTATIATSAKGEVSPSVLEAQKRRIQVVKKVAPSVVAVFGQTARGGGSGVLISPDGYALTNFHVTKGAGDWMRCGLNDGKVYDTVIVSIDPTGDVALIKLLGRNDFPYSKMGDSDKVQNGDWAYAMGNPFLLATDFSPTVTYGVVSGVHRYQYPSNTFLEYTDCIQIDTSINPGNSGGPLFNEAGEVIGINGRGSFEKRGRVNSGAGYAISINQIKHFMGHLKSGRILDHATLGATVSTETDGSIVIGSIMEDSEAYRRGLRMDDEIVSFAGRPIHSVNQYKNILGIYPAGWQIPIVYRHENKKHEVYVKLRPLHRKSELTPKPKKRPQAHPKKEKKGKKKKIPVLGKPKFAGPPKYKHMLIKKPGYANYYFNQLHQERLMKILGDLGDFSTVKGKWTLAGKHIPLDNAKEADPFIFTMAKEGVGLETGAATFYQKLTEGDKPQDEPRGTGGLLIAMQHLKILLTEGKEPFTEFYYLGTEPLDGKGDKVDVLVTLIGTVKIHWFFKENTFIGFDTWLEKDAEECAIRIQKIKEFKGRRFPSQLVVRHQEKEIIAFGIESIKLDSK